MVSRELDKHTNICRSMESCPYLELDRSTFMKVNSAMSKSAVNIQISKESFKIHENMLMTHIYLAQSIYCNESVKAVPVNSSAQQAMLFTVVSSLGEQLYTR